MIVGDWATRPTDKQRFRISEIYETEYNGSVFTNFVGYTSSGKPIGFSVNVKAQ